MKTMLQHSRVIPSFALPLCSWCMINTALLDTADEIVAMYTDETRLNPLSTDALFTLALTSEDEEQSWSAIEQLQRLNTEAVFPQAIRLCHSHEARQRRVGVDILAQLGLSEHTFHEPVMQVLLAMRRRANRRRGDEA